MKLNLVGKKLLSVFTAAALVVPLGVTIFTTSASGVETTLRGEGTSENPYLISSKADLDEYNRLIDDTYWGRSSYAKLTRDIDYQPAGGTEEWTPLGDTHGRLGSETYQGVFDGNGHTISHLYNKSTSTNEIGFIGYLNGGTVKNLTLKDCTFIGDKYVGAFVGKSLSNSNIINCHNKNTYVKASDKVGGIVGAAYKNKISGCTSTGTVENYSSSLMTEMGGIVGYAETLEISDCYNSGNINLINENGLGDVSSASGIVGICEENADIRRCGFSGNISTDIDYEKVHNYSFPSGILGCDTSEHLFNRNTQTVTIKDCYNNGNMYYNDVRNNTRMGLISKFNLMNDDNLTIENCFSNSNLIVSLRGDIAKTCDFLNCYIKKITYYNYPYMSKITNTCSEVTDAQMKSGEVAYNLKKNSKISAQWGQKIGTDPYPSLNAPQVNYGYENCKSTKKVYSNANVADERKFAHTYNSKGVCTVCGESITNAGDGTKEHPVPISSREDLEIFAKTINTTTTASKMCAYLTQDIDLNPGTTFTSDGKYIGNTPKTFTPIGTTIRNRFEGVIDGRGHTISGLYINSNSDAGLVGIASGCTVQNLTLKNSYIKGSGYVGGFVGFDYCPKSLKNLTVSSDCYIKANSKGGGIIGADNANNLTEIVNCTNNGTVTSNYVAGGIIGYGVVTNLNRCVNNGNITAENYCGGIMGLILADSNRITTNITNCVNNGNISSEYYAGGFVGSVNMPLNIKNSYCGKCTIKGGNTSSVAFPRLKDRYGIGFSNTLPEVNIENFCYNNNSSLQIFPSGNKRYVTVKNAEKLSDTQFASGQAAYILNGKTADEDSVWGQKLGTDKVPVFDSQTVYFGKDCTGKEFYTNNKNDFEHVYGKSGKCKKCGNFKDTMSAYCGNSLVADGKIGLDFYMEIAENYANKNTKMVFSVMDINRKSETEKVMRTEEVSFNDAQITEYEGKKYYKFTCHLSPKELENIVMAQVVNGSKKGTEFTASAKDYAYKLLNDEDVFKETSVEQKEVVIAILNYGSAAQQVLDYNTENPSNRFLPQELRNLPETTAKDLEDFAPVPMKNMDYTGSVNYYGSSLVLDYEMAIKHYFTVDGNVDLSDITCKDANGKTYDVEPYGNGFVVKIDGISISELGKEYTITVKDGKTIANQIIYSPLSYAYTILKKNPDENNALTDVAKAMYQLYQKVEVLNNVQK